MKDIFNSARDFATFDFLLSHAQLLIRAQARGEFRKNLDVVFKAVAYTQLPTYFNGLSIRQCRPADAPTLAVPGQALLKTHTAYKLFELVSEGSSHYVVAGSVWVFENELAPMKSCLTNDETLYGSTIASSDSKPFWAGLFGG